MTFSPSQFIFVVVRGLFTFFYCVLMFCFLHPVKFWVRIPLVARCTRCNIIRESSSVTCAGRGFPKKTDRHNINWNSVESGVRHHISNSSNIFFVPIKLFIILQWLSKVVAHVVPYQPYLSIFFSNIFELCLHLNRANILLAGQKVINQSIILQLQGMVQKS